MGHKSQLQKEADTLAMHTWIGTDEELEARKIAYVEQGGSFYDILNNY